MLGETDGTDDKLGTSEGTLVSVEGTILGDSDGGDEVLGATDGASLGQKSQVTGQALRTIENPR